MSGRGYAGSEAGPLLGSREKEARTMAASLVTLEGADGIFTLTLRRPEALNALSTELCVGVLEARRG